MGRKLAFGITASLALSAALALMTSSAGAAGACSPSSPQYCPAPSVQTGVAIKIGSTSATLTGTVNPNGSATSCRFAYGKTTSYGSATPIQNVGSGTTTVAVSATITGLTPNTTYHYLLVCANLGGVAVGGDRSFTTGCKIVIKTKVATVGPKGRLFIKLRHPEKGTCKATLTVKSLKGKVLSNSKKFKIGANKTKRVRVQLKKKPLNQLKTSKTHKRKARAVVKTGSQKTKKKIKLKLQV